ncbi:hypothetical protein [Clostridium thailandense]|uniref:hypothetical protein n=1 Tax=Clostridium thailandense TaxID=2794346 RepID=UPI0039891D20
MIERIQYKTIIFISMMLVVIVSLLGIKWYSSDEYIKYVSKCEEQKLKNDTPNHLQKKKTEVPITVISSTTGVTQINNHLEQEYTPEMAVQLAINKVAQTLELKDTSDIIGECKGFSYKDGKYYAYVRLKSRSIIQAGGIGTIANIYIAEDGSTIGL